MNEKLLKALPNIIALIILAIALAFSYGCQKKGPEILSSYEYLEAFQDNGLVVDTFTRGDKAFVFVSDGYYTFRNDEQIAFLVSLGQIYKGREVIVKSAKTNEYIASYSKDKHIQIIWQEEYTMPQTEVVDEEKGKIN